MKKGKPQPWRHGGTTHAIAAGPPAHINEGIAMSYSIAAISNGGGAPEQAYRKMQSAGACPERPLAGTSTNRLLR